MAQSTLKPTMTRAYIRMPDAFPAVTGARPFSARAAYNKVGVLVCLAALGGMAGWATGSSAFGLVCMIVALVAAVAGTLKPALAKVTAPVYAIGEGVALGWISSQYANLGKGVVPVSIVFTAAVFIAALAAFRSGLVRVTPKFVSITVMATFGLAAVYLLALLGMPVPGANDIGPKGIIFGLVGLAIAVLNLFVDFQFIEVLESGVTLPGRRGAALMSSDGEWYAAQSMMISLVLVYLNVLRIVGAAAGNGRRN